MILYCDLETWSTTPISNGVYRYAEGAEVLLWAYALDDAEPSVWDVTRGDPMPADLRAALDDPSVMTVWHNGAQFDRVVLERAMGIYLPISRIHDTMVQALAHSLPGSLATLCEVLKVPQESAKLADGKKLVRKFCMPLPKNQKLDRATRQTHPTEWVRFMQYAANDITAMREVLYRLPRWNYPGLASERALFELDQTINDRGFGIDMALARAAVEAVEREQARLSEQMQQLTSGAIRSANQRDAFIKFVLEAYGFELPNLQGATVEKLLADESVPEPVRQLLHIRSQAATTSTAKFTKLIETVGSDDRLRGTLQFCGASRTGRWGGRLWQPQNLKRPSREAPEIELGIEAIKHGIADLVDDVMDLASDSIRGCIVPSIDRKLVCADLANIEGRVLAWLGGEQWKLDAFRAYDAGTGDDLYKVAYARAFGIKPSEVTKEQRQTGKCMELALGYQGAVGAFHTFATAYGIDLERLAKIVPNNVPKEVWEQSTQWREKARKLKMPSHGLSDAAWIACDALKNMWRRAHPGTVSLWKEVEAGAVQAITSPMTRVQVRNLLMRREGNWLRVKLPSGRSLCYPSVRIDDEGKVSYLGMNQFTRRFERIGTYGGKGVENFCQAIARDVLAHGMVLAEQNSYHVVASVHDELICEAPDSPLFTAHHLSQLMATVPTWAQGLPLAAEGFEAKRYRK